MMMFAKLFMVLFLPKLNLNFQRGVPEKTFVFEYCNYIRVDENFFPPNSFPEKFQFSCNSNCRVQVEDELFMLSATLALSFLYIVSMLYTYYNNSFSALRLEKLALLNGISEEEQQESPQHQQQQEQQQDVISPDLIINEIRDNISTNVDQSPSSSNSSQQH